MERLRYPEQCFHRRPDLYGGRLDADCSIGGQKVLVDVVMECLCGGQNGMVDAPKVAVAYRRLYLW